MNKFTYNTLVRIEASQMNARAKGCSINEDYLAAVRAELALRNRFGLYA